MRRHTGTFKCEAADGQTVLIFEFTQAAPTESTETTPTRIYITEHQAAAIQVLDDVFAVAGIGVVRRAAPTVQVTPAAAYRPPSPAGHGRLQQPRATGGERDLYQRQIDGWSDPWTT